MALEPLEVTGRGRRPTPSCVDMTRRFWIGLVLDACRSSCWRWAAMSRASACIDLVSPAALHSGCSSCWRRRSCCGPAGRSSQRGWASLVQPQPQHVHADRARHRRGLSLQRGRDVRARRVPGRVPRAWTARSPVYFEAAAVITVLVLLGPGAGAARARADRRRHPRAAQPRAQDRAAHARRTAETRRSRSIRSQVGDRLRVRPGEACRSTARCSKARARSMKSMVTGESMPVEKAAGRPR